MPEAVRPPFAELSPDAVLAATEALEVECDGRLFELNSYENRVYQIGVAAGGFVIAKFYRPRRWSDAQILEEHGFATELAAADLPVAAPLQFAGSTLHRHAGFRYALFPRLPGRPAELDAPGTLEWIGRTLGRMHACGARSRFASRPGLTVARLGFEARRAVLASPLLDAAVAARYAEVSEHLLQAVSSALEFTGPMAAIRVHGDCHSGNILWNEQGPAFVDLDDCMSGPRIQDLWMFLSGSPDERRGQWDQLMAGYRRFAAIDGAEIDLIEPLRALRMIHHAAWIAARWTDPAFPRAFPWFSSPRHWDEHLSDLWLQIDALAAPPMTRD